MSEIVPAFVHDDYERISDDLMWLGYNHTNKCGYVLRFNVSLANVAKDGKRIPFHTEFRYETRKYSNVFAGSTIRRHITYYMSIEALKQDEFGNKDFIMIRQSDMMHLRSKLEIVYSWFNGGAFDTAPNRPDKLIIYKQDSVMIENLAQNKYIIIDPIVMDTNLGDVPGIKVTMNNGNDFNMSMTSFEELYYIVYSMDMYNAASTLMAYFGRPEFGTNLWTNPNDQNRLYENNEPDIDKLEGNKRRELKKGFFG